MRAASALGEAASGQHDRHNCKMSAYRFSGFEADLTSKELRRNGHRVPIQPQPFLVLATLLEACGKLVAREELIQLLWGDTQLADPGHSLNIAVRKLRNALGDSSDEPRLIETVARQGYRFIGEVERVEMDTTPPAEVRIAGSAPWRRAALTGLLLVIVAATAWFWTPAGSLPRVRTLAAQDPGYAQTRLLWDNAVDLSGQVSGDGRYFSYTDWTSDDLGLGLRDLFSGEGRKLTHAGPWSSTKAEVGNSAVSPDGRLVAFSHTTYAVNKDQNTTRLVVIGTDGTNERILLAGGGLDYVHPYSWSPDGKWVAASVVYRGQKPGGRDSIVLVSLEGQVRHLAVKDELWAHNVSFSPDGKYLAYSTGIRKAQPTLMVRPLAGDSQEMAIQSNAMMMGWTPDGAALLFSRERGTTHDLFLLPMSAGKPRGNAETVYTSADVGQSSAGVTRDGSLLYSTFNRRAEAVVLPLSESEIRPESPIASLPATVSVSSMLGPGPVHFSPDGKRIVALTPTDSLTIREIDSGGERTITPDLQVWRAVRWATDRSGLLVLGASKDGRSGVFRVDDTTGRSALLADLPPETWSFTPSNDGRTIYFGTPLKTRARHLATGREEVLFESANGGNYDLRVSHDGSRLAIRGGSYLAVVDLKTGRHQVLYRVQEPDPVRLWAMDWSGDDESLLAIVRPGVGMEQMQLWTFSARGGAPERQPLPPEFRGLSVSPDGKYVATTRLTQRWQLWAISGIVSPKLSRVTLTNKRKPGS